VIWDKPVVLSSANSSGPHILTILGPLVLDQEVIYTASFYDRVVALSAKDGTVLWDRDISASLPVVLAPGMLIAIDADNQVYALNRSTGETLWVQKGLVGRHVSAVAATRSGVLVADGFGYLHALSLSDGHFVARYQLPGGRMNTRPLVYEDTLYLLSEDGKMQALVMKPL
jgi:outer membrane protein assembly factor BamB